MWDTAASRKTGMLVFEWHSRAECVEVITENTFYCLEVHPCVFGPEVSFSQLTRD